jgi:hypothetical protein
VAAGEQAYVSDRPVAGHPTHQRRADVLGRLSQATQRLPYLALLGGPKSGRTTAAQALIAGWEQALRQPQGGGDRLVPVYVDLALVAAGAEHLSAAALDMRLVQAIYAALSTALGNPFVQAHGNALRIPNFSAAALPDPGTAAKPPPKRAAPGARQRTPVDPWALLHQLCGTIWRSLVGTAGSCRTLLLLDNADLLLTPPLRHLQGGLRRWMEPPPLPAPAPEPAGPSPRELARQAPRKGEASADGRSALADAPGRASKKRGSMAGRTTAARRPGAAAAAASADGSASASASPDGSAKASTNGSADASTDGSSDASPGSSGGQPGSVAAGKGPRSAGTGPNAAPERRRPGPQYSVGAVARFHRRIGDPQLGPSSVPSQRPARHLPEGVERPRSLICFGGPALARQLHLQRRTPQPDQPLWAGMTSFALPPLRPPEVAALLRVGGLEAEDPWVALVLQQVGTHPYLLQEGLRQCGRLEPDAAPSALMLRLEPALAPYVAEVKAQLAASPDGREAAILAALEAADGSLTEAEIGRRTGDLPLQPALGILHMCGLLVPQVQGPATVWRAPCGLWNHLSREGANRPED